jgi:hypothetical protein
MNVRPLGVERANSIAVPGACSIGSDLLTSKRCRLRVPTSNMCQSGHRWCSRMSARNVLITMYVCDVRHLFSRVMVRVRRLEFLVFLGFLTPACFVLRGRVSCAQGMPGGLNVCLQCFDGACTGTQQHSTLHFQATGHCVVYNIKRTDAPVEAESQGAATAAAGSITKLAIGVAGGAAAAPAKKYLYENTVRCLACKIDLDKSSTEVRGWSGTHTHTHTHTHSHTHTHTHTHTHQFTDGGGEGVGLGFDEPSFGTVSMPWSVPIHSPSPKK